MLRRAKAKREKRVFFCFLLLLGMCTWRKHAEKGKEYNAGFRGTR
jgi:hypothetical protein